MPDYHRLRFRLPTELEDELAAELWARGSIGVELRTDGQWTVLDAYFDASRSSGPTELPAIWDNRDLTLVADEGVSDDDWLATYRSVSRPFEVGRRWLIDPGEPEGPVPAVAERETLRIPARRAFGTGSHESTRLLLEWLEDLRLAGRRVLDVGTGSGILSLAAERLGAASVVGLDPDPVAIWMARENRRLNAGSLGLLVADLGCLRGRAFDLALINILPVEWLSDAPALGDALTPEATLLLSGIPLDQGVEVARAVGACGWAVREERRSGEWIAYRAEGAG